MSPAAARSRSTVRAPVASSAYQTLPAVDAQPDAGSLASTVAPAVVPLTRWGGVRACAAPRASLGGAACAAAAGASAAAIAASVAASEAERRMGDDRTPGDVRATTP